MDRDKAKIELKEAINNLINSDKYTEIGGNRSGYVGDETINLMAEAALSVLLGIEDAYDYMKKEDIVK